MINIVFSIVYSLGSVWSGNRTFPGLGVGSSRVRVPDLIRSDLRTFTGREDGGGRSLYFGTVTSARTYLKQIGKAATAYFFQYFCALPAVLCRYLQIVVAVGQCGDDEGKV